MSNEYVVNFNKELSKFLKYLNTIIQKDDNLKILKNISEDNNRIDYIISFWNNIQNKSKLLSEHNEFLFCKENNIVEQLSLYEYYNNENMNEDNKNKLWEYLEFLYLYSYSYKSNIDELNNKLNNIGNELENKDNSETLQSWLAIVDNIKNNKKRIENSENIEDEEKEGNDFNIPNLNLPKIDKEMFDKFESYSDQITSGPIGKLAKDIAENIDIDEFANPMELLTSLCNGDFKNNKLMSLINTVGGELNSKMNNNELNQDDLMKDASNIVQNFSTMFNQEDMSNMQNTQNNQNNESKPKRQYSNNRKEKTRERLLKKLEERKNKK